MKNLNFRPSLKTWTYALNIWTLTVNKIPFIKKGTAGIFYSLEMQKACCDQQRLYVVLIDFNLPIVGKIYQRLERTGKYGD